MARPAPIVIAITGASGVIYGRRLLEVLVQHDTDIHLTISDSGRQVIEHELQQTIDLNQFQLVTLLPEAQPKARLHYHHYKDFMAPIASGSFPTRAMVICPCSGSTLSGIAGAASQNLIQRAADVHLKEKRRLILVTRETPLSLAQIRNMESACLAGATVMPASPGFYHGSQSVDQLVDFVVARILDHIQIEHRLSDRWGQNV